MKEVDTEISTLDSQLNSYFPIVRDMTQLKQQLKDITVSLNFVLLKKKNYIDFIFYLRICVGNNEIS